MKIIINNLAWLKLADIDQVTLHLFRNELTIIPKEFKTFNQNRKPIYLYALTDKWLGMPRPYYFSRKHMLKNPEEEYRISGGVPLSDLDTNIVLRPEDQEPMVKYAVDYFKKHECAGGAIEAFTSFGKTVSAFEIIKRVGLNTLVILHRENLLDQWQKSLQRFWPNVSIGRVQGTDCDYLGKDITFSMVQTLMSDNSEKFPKGFFEHFGLVVIDEFHIMGAEKFGSVIPKFANKYTLMLSGTDRRADGCENVYKFAGGNTIYKVSEQNRIRPKIYVIDTKFMPNKSCKDKVKALAVITESKVRNELIAMNIIKALKAGRNPLVMSERLDQLKNISTAVTILAKRNLMNISQGFYIGGRSEKQLEEASACDVVYATIQLAKEGVDIPRLDTLFLASPVGEVEQITGRVVRFKEGKKQPFVIDFVDLNISCFKSSFTSRYKLYNKLNFEVHGVEGNQFSFLDYI